MHFYTHKVVDLSMLLWDPALHLNHWHVLSFVGINQYLFLSLLAVITNRLVVVAVAGVAVVFSPRWTLSKSFLLWARKVGAGPIAGEDLEVQLVTGAPCISIKTKHATRTENPLGDPARVPQTHVIHLYFLFVHCFPDTGFYGVIQSPVLLIIKKPNLYVISRC